jgi:hypothetical protein
MTPEIILERTGIDVTGVEQGDESWHRLRLGVITASEVHNVISKPRSGKKWTDMKMSYFTRSSPRCAPAWRRKLTPRRWPGETV